MKEVKFKRAPVVGDAFKDEGRVKVITNIKGVTITVRDANWLETAYFNLQDVVQFITDKITKKE